MDPKSVRRTLENKIKRRKLDIGFKVGRIILRFPFGSKKITEQEIREAGDIVSYIQDTCLKEEGIKDIKISLDYAGLHCGERFHKIFIEISGENTGDIEDEYDKFMRRIMPKIAEKYREIRLAKPDQFFFKT